MASRDYVKRGNQPRPSSPKTKKHAARAPQASASPVFPLKLAITALVLVVLFIAGLRFLSVQGQPSEAAVSVEPSTATVSSAVAQTKPLPPIPEEKWSYIEALENKEIEVVINEQEISDRPYLMQCGAYRNQAQADERKAMIAFQGLSSEIRAAQGEKGMWYRIILGPYQSKRKAEQDRNLLRRANIEPCAIWFWE